MWELLPSVLIVYLGIKVIIEMIQAMQYFPQRGTFVLAIAFCGAGAAGILTGGVMVLYGLQWAGEIIRGEHTGAELNPVPTAKVAVGEEDENPHLILTSAEP